MSNDIWMKYFESSKYKNMKPTPEQKGLPQPPIELDYDTKRPLIELPKPSTLEISQVDLRKVLEERKSLRNYRETSLTLNDISWLLWSTQGIKRFTDRPSTIRTVPSAGARHPFETYFVVNRVEGLNPGLYRYIASKHMISEIKYDEGLISKFAEENWSSQMILNSAVLFIWVAISERMIYRYGNRGYRYLHLDAGHVCQNLYLASEAIDCGVCAIGGFYDDIVNALLSLDGKNHFIIYMATVGKK